MQQHPPPAPTFRTAPRSRTRSGTVPHSARAHTSSSPIPRGLATTNYPRQTSAPSLHSHPAPPAHPHSPHSARAHTSSRPTPRGLTSTNYPRQTSAPSLHSHPAPPAHPHSPRSPSPQFPAPIASRTRTSAALLRSEADTESP